MDADSLVQFEGKLVKLTLINNFWYKARILSVTKEAVTFIEMRGKNVSVQPQAILMIEEINSLGGQHGC